MTAAGQFLVEIVECEVAQEGCGLSILPLTQFAVGRRPSDLGQVTGRVPVARFRGALRDVTWLCSRARPVNDIRASQQPKRSGTRHRFGARADGELRKDALDVRFHRLR
jgi:hypothetical protein